MNDEKRDLMRCPKCKFLTYPITILIPDDSIESIRWHEQHLPVFDFRITACMSCIAVLPDDEMVNDLINGVIEIRKKEVVFDPDLIDDLEIAAEISWIVTEQRPKVGPYADLSDEEWEKDNHRYRTNIFREIVGRNGSAMNVELHRFDKDIFNKAEDRWKKKKDFSDKPLVSSNPATLLELPFEGNGYHYVVRTDEGRFRCFDFRDRGRPLKHEKTGDRGTLSVHQIRDGWIQAWKGSSNDAEGPIRRSILTRPEHRT